MTATNAGKYVGLRRGKCWERTENSDYYCGGCGWKVTDHDSYCPECGGALHKGELMNEGVEVGKALLRYRDNPPIKRAGPIEGTWYTMGEILSIIMDKPEFTTGELLTRLAYLMGVRE